MSTKTIKTVWTVSVLLFINLLNYMDRYTLAGEKLQIVHGLYIFFVKEKEVIASVL